ncbi:hypothetical protein Tco_1157810, partial [Tanacetum coccineum]
LETFSLRFGRRRGRVGFFLLVVVGVVGIVVGKKRLGDVVEKFGHVGIVVEVAIVEMQLVDQD